MTTAPIVLDTPNYRLRTLGLQDAEAGLANWLADPETARLLNAKPRALTTDEIRTYIASFDSKTKFLFGIFEKETNTLVGMRSVYVDTQRRAFLDNILIGEIEARGKRARSESSIAVWRYFFQDMDLLVARGAITADNEHMFAVAIRRGWVHDGTSHVPSAAGGKMIELRHIRLDRDTWRRLYAEPST